MTTLDAITFLDRRDDSLIHEPARGFVWRLFCHFWRHCGSPMVAFHRWFAQYGAIGRTKGEKSCVAALVCMKCGAIFYYGGGDSA